MSDKVLVVGAGPTGLSLAITLRRFDVPVRIIDRLPEPAAVSKALVVWSGSLEALQGMGVVDEFLGAGKRLHAVQIGDGPRKLAELAVGDGIDSPFPFPILLPQSRTEAILHKRLAALGVAVERGVELVGLTDDGAGVTATLRRTDGTTEEARVRPISSAVMAPAASFATPSSAPNSKA
jgi:2-polyprenyl-6-methoxyphenol hydroxylase-like FAD-dependent oxidoreductase